jgi:hypothetical protein
VLEGILVGIIDASLLRKAMQSCSGVDTTPWGNRRADEAQIQQTRLLMSLQLASPISWPLLIVVASWSILLFCGFGILSRLNITTLAALALGSFAIGSAIFLILELNEPYSGLFKVPRGAMQQAIEALG